MTKQIISDEELVCFADGLCDDEHRRMVEAALVDDVELRHRLDALKAVGAKDLGMAMNLSLHDAPIEALEDFLSDHSKAEPQDPSVIKPETNTTTVASASKGFLVACIVSAMVIGGLASLGFIGMFGANKEITNWRESVAVYQMLYTEQTLASVKADTSATNQRQKQLSKLSGLKIQILNLKEHGLTFKRGQILEFKGAKLVQLAYLSSTGKPVAICFVHLPSPNVASTQEKRHGLNIVHWVQNGVPGMVIGDLPSATLEKISTAVTAPLS